MPKIYIIILNYCSARDTIACLESVFKLVYSSYHVILVDNHSSDNSIKSIEDWANGKLLAEEHKQELSLLVKPYAQKPLKYDLLDEKSLGKRSQLQDITIISALSNRGYSAGNNIGLQYAIAQEDGQYYWLINNDMLITPDSLSELVKCHQHYQESDKIGIVGGKLLYYDKPTTIQCLGGGTYNKFIGFIKQVGDHSPQEMEGSFNRVRLDYVSGACMLIKDAFVKEIGLLSEDYFLYYEELDWCTRGRKKGWNIAYTNKAVLYHKVGATINVNQKRNQKSEISDYYGVRSKLLYSYKYNSCIANITIRIGLIGTVINRLLRGQFRRIFVIIKLAFTSRNSIYSCSFVKSQRFK